MNTIKEAVELLQKSVSAALPGMVVSVNISLSPAAVNEVVNIIPEEIPEQLAKDIDIAALRSFLNEYAKKAGPTKAINLVKKYTGSESKNPTDIDSKKYKDLVHEITKECPGMEITLGKDAA